MKGTNAETSASTKTLSKEVQGDACIDHFRRPPS